MEMSNTTEESLGFSWYSKKPETLRDRLAASGYEPALESTEAGSYVPPPYIGPKEEEETVVNAITPPLVRNPQRATTPPSTSMTVGQDLWATLKNAFSMSDEARLDQAHDLAVKASLNNKLL